VHLLVSEQYIDSIMHDATIKFTKFYSPTMLKLPCQFHEEGLKVVIHSHKQTA